MGSWAIGAQSEEFPALMISGSRVSYRSATTVNYIEWKDILIIVIDAQMTGRFWPTCPVVDDRRSA
jgi:hypothetical protein